MVSVKLMGGISNQLFMMAACYAHAKRNNVDYLIPLAVDNPHYEGQKVYKFPGINYRTDLPVGLPFYTEPFYTYSPIPDLDNIVLLGYFQSEKYFQDYKEEFINALGVDWELKEDTVSIHVRRSDYLKLPNYHPVITTLYLDRAIAHYFDKGYKKFIVFSDDMDWCYENIHSEHFLHCEFEYSEGRTELEDLVFGSCCAHQIGSNSTFSIWMHILNRNPEKTCVLPKEWFGPALTHDTKDLYPTTAIIISNE